MFLALHGLEASSSAHYVRGLLAEARGRGWRALALNFRGCSGDVNRLVRSYHSGETSDLAEAIRRARLEADQILLAGCSLGGNVLVKWLGEQGEAAPREIKAAVAISVPFDLALCAVNTSINTLTISSEGHTQPGCSSLRLRRARSVPDRTGGSGEQRGMTVWKPFDPLLSDPQVSLWVEY